MHVMVHFLFGSAKEGSHGLQRLKGMSWLDGTAEEGDTDSN